ncbi:LOW QUALITY PROTEIN: uncharacterized protein LOC135221189 [Macrobrachium nipponense]|uniref:LOW QUALITY PROTEIN: uncharacterized protein LOC135221189 n=1 Tax=Macrobrachium nipponense TaxID=159736 RepID=UPI0030C8B464
MAPRIADSHRAKKQSPRGLSAAPSCRRKLFSVLLNSTTPYRKMPKHEIFLAAERGDLREVKDLLQHTGPAVRKPCSRFTLLHVAALNNQKQIVEFLLEFINPNVVGSLNRTPAHLAALRGHLEVLQVLLADQETNPDIKNNLNQTYKDLLATHLFEAILSGNEKQTRGLLALGANPDCHPGNDTEGVLSRELHITTPRQLALSLNQESILMLLPTDEEGHPVTKHGHISVSPTIPRIGRDPMQLGPLRIKVKPATQCVTGRDVYPMNPDSRGYVCILSFGSFERRPDLELEASEDDASNLANVFNQMGYSGEVHHSLTSNATKETLTRIREMKELWGADSATFIISSHGTISSVLEPRIDLMLLPTDEEGHPVTKHGHISVSPTIPRIGRDPMQLGPLRIKVKPATQCVTGRDVYPMNPDSRGYVCILSFGSFERRPDLELEASEDDASNLANVFNQMGYSGEVHHSLTSNATKETLTRIREMKELWGADSATFIISSHGTSNNDAFLASDMQQLSTEWLLGFFSDAECPQLKNKPKLFIFDFCRGYYLTAVQYSRSFRPTRVNEPQRDMVCIYSSNTGFTSYNFSKDGSIFPTALCRTMAKHAHDLELNDLCRELPAALFEYRAKDGGPDDVRQPIQLATDAASRLLYLCFCPTE